MQLPESEPGLVSAAQGRWLRYAARAVPTYQPIVELGSYRGKSTACLAVGSREGHSPPVVAVDLWTDHPGAFYHDPDNRAQFDACIERYEVADLVFALKSDTIAAADQWPWILRQLEKREFHTGHEIGLLWIDANHRYESVREDFTAWEPLVTPGGIVAFHDYVDDSAPVAVQAKAEKFAWGVQRFVDERLDWTQVARVGTLIAFRKPE